AFDIATGEQRWFWTQELPTLTVRGGDAPALGPGYVFIGNDDGAVMALVLADGQPIWAQQGGQPHRRTELERMADIDGGPVLGQPDGRTELGRMAHIDGSPVLDKVTLFASSYRGQTMAIEAPSGRPLWASDRGGPGRLGSAFDRLVIADREGTVWALDKASGP